jgi:hypothetical protein
VPPLKKRGHIPFNGAPPRKTSEKSVRRNWYVSPFFRGDRGFSKQQIESDRFRVHFDAGCDVDFNEAEDLALRRAAELTLAEIGTCPRFLPSGKVMSQSKENGQVPRLFLDSRTRISVD